MTLESVTNPTKVSDTNKTGNILETEYIIQAKGLNNHISTYKNAPPYITSSLGNITFE